MIVDDLAALALRMQSREMTLDAATMTLGEIHPSDVLLIAEELCAHMVVPPHDWRWWCDVVSYRAEHPKDRYTLARLARDASVQYQSLYSGRISPEDGERCAAIVTVLRDRLFGRWLREAETAYRANAAFVGRFHAEVGAGITASADTCARALLPLHAAPAETGTAIAYVREGLDPTYIAARAPRETRATLACSACRYMWMPRVEQPAKCPRCQRYLVWETAPVAALDTL